MQSQYYPTETVLSTTRNRVVLSFKDTPRKPLGPDLLSVFCHFLNQSFVWRPEILYALVVRISLLEVVRKTSVRP